MNMSDTDGRFSPELRGKIAHEHRHRYQLAEYFVGGLDVLDIASGEGYGASQLASRARSVVGVDRDEAKIRNAQARYAARNLDFRLGSALELPIEEQSVDIVVCFGTLEHIDDHDALMREFARVLRPEGLLLISTPNKLVFSERLGIDTPHDVRELSYDYLHDLLGRYFAQSNILGQRLVGGSVIATIEPVQLSPGRSEMRSVPVLSLPLIRDPEYFIAVCSRKAEPTLHHVSSFFYEPDEDIEACFRAAEVAKLYERIDKLENELASRAALDDHDLVGRLDAHEALECEMRSSLAELEARNAALAKSAEHTLTLEREVRELKEKAVENAFAVEALEGRNVSLCLEIERLALADVDRSAVSAENELLRARVTMLENVRERMYESSSRIRAEHEARLRQLSVEVDKIQAKNYRIAELERKCAALASDVQERDRRLDEAMASAATRAREFDAAIERERELLQGVLEREERLSDLRYSLDRHAALVLDLSHATRIAAESNASLELVRMQLESDLTSRVAISESKATQMHAALHRLIDDSSVLIGSLQLRERRIVTLESALRDVATDLLRAAELEKERYDAMQTGLMSSKIVRLRSLLANVSLAARAWVSKTKRADAALPPVTDEMNSRRSRKRSRHLRSA